MALDNVEQFRSKRDEALNFIQSKTDFQPEYLLILGTGLGQLGDEIDVQDSISYDEIPHFPVSTVESHAGRLLFGMLGGKKVIAMQGRFHFYEGYTMNFQDKCNAEVKLKTYSSLLKIFKVNICTNKSEIRFQRM